MDKLLVLDCETTGFEPPDAKVVEIAGAVVDSKSMMITNMFSQLVNPGIPIPPEAMGVHHIQDIEVKGKPILKKVMEKYVNPLLPAHVVAHNSEFDSKFIPVMGDWICTFRCAKHIWPDCPSFSNQTLRYYLKLFKEPEVEAFPPHRARADVWVTAHVLIRMLAKHSPEELVEMTKHPILLRKVHFGKHLGTPWSEVPKDYLQWIIRQNDFDRDVLHTAKHYSGVA
jgi:exodeoxyribonuclease X